MANFAASICTFGCISLSWMVDWPSVQVIDPVERHLDSRDDAIIRVVDLCGNDAHGRVAIAYLPHEKP